MRISTNTNALFAQNQVQRTDLAIARAMKRLSSGLRVSSPSDGAADYSTAVGLESQMRGIRQSNLNLNSAFGIIEISSGALSSQMEIVQRMRELSVQSANEIISDSDRLKLDQEFQGLYAQFQQITSSTNFNGINLLDNSNGPLEIQVGSQASDKLSFSLANSTPSSVFVLRKTVGDGTFSNATTFTSVANSEYLQTADMNEDGNKDLITLTSNTLSILLGNGNGTFQTRITYYVNATTTSDLGIADINKDGNLDVLTANMNAGTVSIFLGNGNGSLRNPTNIASPNYAADIEFNDFNNDGNLDFASPMNFFYNAVAVYIGNGDGTFRAAVTYATGANPRDALSKDINADGKVDLIVTDQSSATVSILLGNGDGTFQARTTLASGNSPQSPAIGDINSDSKWDLIVSDQASNTISVYLGNGDGTFQVRTTYAATPSPAGLALADTNGDGTLDILSAQAGNSVNIYYGVGNGTFNNRTPFAGGTSTVIADDFNNDDVIDIIGDLSTTAYIMLGNTTLGTQTPIMDIRTLDNASDMLLTLDYAIQQLSSSMSSLGAERNRLEYTLSTNQVLMENIQSARSVVVDTDYSEEVANLVKNQILQQAQIAMLGQANASLSLILRLLSP